MQGVTAPVHGNLIDRHVQRIFQVVLRQNVVDVFVFIQKSFEVKSSPGFEVSMVLENVTEAVELGFIPELAACGRGYL